MRAMSLGFFPSYIDMDALPSKLWTQCKQHTTNKRRNHSKHVANFQHICTLEKKTKKTLLLFVPKAGHVVEL